MTTFCRFITHPFPQLWLVRVRKEFQPFVQSALNESLFGKNPRFATAFAQLFFATGAKSNRSDILVKRMQAQKAADYVRRLVFCQGKREFQSSYDMMEMGLKCPTPIGYAINLNPFSRYDSLFICGFLSDAVHISEHIRTLSEADRLTYLKMVTRDISLMFANNVFHKDLHLKNILLCPSDPLHLYWIDNDLRSASRRKMIKFKESLLPRLISNIPFCSDKEKAFFMEELSSLFNEKKQSGVDG